MIESMDLETNLREAVWSLGNSFSSWLVSILHGPLPTGYQHIVFNIVHIICLMKYLFPFPTIHLVLPWPFLHALFQDKLIFLLSIKLNPTCILNDSLNSMSFMKTSRLLHLKSFFSNVSLIHLTYIWVHRHLATHSKLYSMPTAFSMVIFNLCPTEFLQVT